MKDLGVNIICLEKQVNWAKKYVDHWIVANTSDIKESFFAVEKFIKTKAIEINGVYTYWEDSVLLTSFIAERMQLVGIPFKTAGLLRNKLNFRKFCKLNNIATPGHLLVQKDKIDFCRDEVRFPVVLKPSFGSGSAYVVKINSFEELENTVKYLSLNMDTQVESALEEGMELMIEEYIEGSEVDIDILLQNGKIKFYSISDNYKTIEPYFVETGQSIPTSLPLKAQNELINMAEEVLEKFGVMNGCIHFEAKWTQKGAVPIEVNLRMGGDEVYSFVKEAWGVDLIENALKISVGKYIKINKPSMPKKYLVGEYFLPDKSGILVNKEIEKNLKEFKNLEEFNFYFENGDVVLAPPEGFDYLGWFTVSGSNHLEADENLEIVKEMVDFKIAEFDSTSVLGKNQEEQ
jgi:glutathione synthase/RimK-type ligase-like ATP-grasp enzyme